METRVTMNLLEHRPTLLPRTFLHRLQRRLHRLQANLRPLSLSGQHPLSRLHLLLVHLLLLDTLLPLPLSCRPISTSPPRIAIHRLTTHARFISNGVIPSANAALLIAWPQAWEAVLAPPRRTLQRR